MAEGHRAHVVTSHTTRAFCERLQTDYTLVNLSTVALFSRLDADHTRHAMQAVRHHPACADDADAGRCLPTVPRVPHQAKHARLSMRWTMEVGGLQRVARHASLLRRADSEPSVVHDRGAENRRHYHPDDECHPLVHAAEGGPYVLMDVVRELF